MNINTTGLFSLDVSKKIYQITQFIVFFLTVTIQYAPNFCNQIILRLCKVLLPVLSLMSGHKVFASEKPTQKFLLQ